MPSWATCYEETATNRRNPPLTLNGSYPVNVSTLAGRYCCFILNPISPPTLWCVVFTRVAICIYEFAQPPRLQIHQCHYDMPFFMRKRLPTEQARPSQDVVLALIILTCEMCMHFEQRMATGSKQSVVTYHKYRFMYGCPRNSCGRLMRNGRGYFTSYFQMFQLKGALPQIRSIRSPRSPLPLHAPEVMPSPS